MIITDVFFVSRQDKGHLTANAPIIVKSSHNNSLHLPACCDPWYGGFVCLIVCFFVLLLIRAILLFACWGPCFGGFVLCRLNQTRVCDRAILLFLGNFVALFFFFFSTKLIQILDYLKWENATKPLHSMFMKWSQFQIYSHNKLSRTKRLVPQKKRISQALLNGIGFSHPWQNQLSKPSPSSILRPPTSPFFLSKVFWTPLVNKF